MAALWQKPVGYLRVEISTIYSSDIAIRTIVGRRETVAIWQYDFYTDSEEDRPGRDHRNDFADCQQ